MSWKIDNIDFKDYGVGVIKSSGVLDMPKIVDESTDWLDLNGKDYWQDAADVKYQDREISLNCWIKAAGYEGFKTKVAAFYAALMAPGERTLTTVYGNEIEHVTVQQAIQMVRKTAYVSSLQIGMFALRLTVAGDLNFFQLNISRYYTYNIIATVLTTDLKVQKTLQGDTYATFSFETNQKLDIRFFDDININSSGISTDRFYIETEPEFKKVADNKYVYSIRANHMGNWLSHSQFLNDLGESDFSYFANLDEIIVLVLNNHGRDYFTRKFFKGTIETTERRLHKFSGENCLSVLRRLCTEYKLEYEFESLHETQWEFNINVKTQIANDKAIALEYGKGKGLYEITRGEMLADELCTVLHAYGATRNLKPDYRAGLRRLSFTGNPLSQNYGFDYPAGDWGVHAKTIFFDEIFPRRTGAVTSYLQKLPAALTDSEKYAHPEGIFKITDSTLDFDINAYLLGGLSAKVVMKTGDLAGMQFEINRYDNDTKEIYIIPFKDERGDLYPTGVLTIQAGNEYTLIDIDQPASYIVLAEAELAAAAAEYLTAHCLPKYPYRALIHPAFVKAQVQPFGFEVGDRVPFLATEYGLNGPLRISALVYDAFKGTYDLTLSEIVQVSKRKQTDMRLEAIERALGDAKKDTVEATRKDQETTNELRNRILDPTDDKLNADRNVRIESIDPGMLSLDAGVPQWSVKDALIETNVDGDEDKIVVGGGVLIISNFYTLGRYAIQKLKEALLEYDPTRTWIINETIINLPTKEAYFIYGKLTLAEGSTVCEILAYPEHKEVKLTIGYLYYKLGSISSGEEAPV